MVEHRAYEVLWHEGSLELRRYPAYLTASISVDADSYDEATHRAFGALAGYIFGDNVASGSIPMTSPVTASRAGEKIAMTAPVTSERVRNEELASVEPLCTVSCAGAYVVRFTMPSRYDSVDQLPAPNDPRVSLEVVPAHLAVVARFGGHLSEASVARALGQLQGVIGEQGLVRTGEPEAAQYDAPWIPGFARHNEVLLPVSRV